MATADPTKKGRWRVKGPTRATGPLAFSLLRVLGADNRCCWFGRWTAGAARNVMAAVPTVTPGAFFGDGDGDNGQGRAEIKRLRELLAEKDAALAQAVPSWRSCEGHY